MTSEDTKFIIPVEMEFLNMIPQGDSDLTTYLIELLWTNVQEQQTNKLSFPTPENPGNSRIIVKYSHETSENYMNWKHEKI